MPTRISGQRTFIYRSLASWKVAKIVSLFTHGIPTQFGDLRLQVERAVLSISNNAAEACGRHLKGGKNIENLFSHANGSLSEASNMLDFCFDLHASANTQIDWKIREFLDNLLLLASDELDCLIKDTSFMNRPGDIGVFKQEEILVLDNILKELSLGKEIREILSGVFMTEEPTAKESANGRIPRDNCFNCRKKTPLNEGQDFKIIVVTDLSRGKINSSVFICKRCAEKKGVPKELDHGNIIWKAKPDVAQAKSESVDHSPFVDGTVLLPGDDIPF